MILSEICNNNNIKIIIILYFNGIFFWNPYFPFVECRSSAKHNLRNSCRRYGGRLRDMVSIPGKQRDYSDWLWLPPSLVSSGRKATGREEFDWRDKKKLRII
jgi:hypothetical protein